MAGTTYSIGIIEKDPLIAHAISVLCKKSALISSAIIYPYPNRLKYEPAPVKLDLILILMPIHYQSAFDISDIIRSHYPKQKICFITNSIHEELLARIKSEKINAIFDKNINPRLFHKILHKVLVDGKNYFQPASSTHPTDNQEFSLNRLIFGVSRKEKEYLKHLMNGSSYKEIATLMQVSLRQVYAYKYQLLRKIKSENTIDLLKLALQVHPE